MKRGLDAKDVPANKRKRVSLPSDVVGFLITSLNNTGLKVGAPYNVSTGDEETVGQVINDDNSNSMRMAEFLRGKGFIPKPFTSSKKPELLTLSVTHVLTHLQDLISRDIIHVDGVVLKVVNDRAAVLFDISLTSRLASHRKDRSMAFILNHLSCNWNLRRLVMASPHAINDEDVLKNPFCHVIGCAMHPLNPIPADFNVCSIITGLPAYEPEIGKGIRASKLTKTGIWDLPDHVLRIICGKLNGKMLHKFGLVCKHTCLLTRPMLPSGKKLKLFPHQETTLQWMLEREMPRELANPMYKLLRSKEGKFVYGNCIKGDLTTVEPYLLRDIRGGIVCDEPGAGKTATVLSLIYKTRRYRKRQHSDVISDSTLVIVPLQLVSHWTSQIQKHFPKGLTYHVFRDEISAYGLGHFDVVIATFSQLSLRWGKENAIQDVHWLRIIVDEGHTLGENSTKKAKMTIALKATRRWILTRTTDFQLKHLRTWLKVLHDELYMSKRNSLTAVLECFEGGQYEGKVQIVELLQRCMLCTKRADIRLRPCNRSVELLDFTADQAARYSQMPEILNWCMWVGYDWSTLCNIACLVDISISIKNEVVAANNILASLKSGTKCSRCDQWCRLPVLTPCLHFLCITCVSSDYMKCSSPSCGCPFEKDTMDEVVPLALLDMQPDYSFQADGCKKVDYILEELDSLIKHNNWKEEKVFIFSQFCERLDAVIQRLTDPIRFQVVRRTDSLTEKQRHIIHFQGKDLNSSNLLLMEMAAWKTLSGMDLSCITRMYLMEPISDPIVEENLITRAHRMGSRKPLHVKTLAVRGSIEEQMLKTPLQELVLAKMFGNADKSLGLSSM